MPGLEMFYNTLQTDQENLISIQANRKVGLIPPGSHLTTSEKIRYLLTKFPSAQPARPNAMLAPNFGPPYSVCKDCLATDCLETHRPIPSFPNNNLETNTEILIDETPRSGTARKGRTWGIVGELMQFMKLAVTVTALILYYVIYGWMKFILTGFKVATFFRHADGPMKTTLGVVAVTTLIVGYNLFVRIQKLFEYVEIMRS